MTLEAKLAAVCFLLALAFLAVAILLGCNELALHQYALQQNGKVYRIYDRYRGEPVLIYNWEQKEQALESLSAWNSPMIVFRKERPSPWTSGKWETVK